MIMTIFERGIFAHLLSTNQLAIMLWFCFARVSTIDIQKQTLARHIDLVDNFGHYQIKYTLLGSVNSRKEWCW